MGKKCKKLLQNDQIFDTTQDIERFILRHKIWEFQEKMGKCQNFIQKKLDRQDFS